MWVICISLLIFLIFLLLPLRIKIGVKIELKTEEISVNLGLGLGILYINSFSYRLGWDRIEKFIWDKRWLKKRAGLNIDGLKKIYYRLSSFIFIESFTWETVWGLDNAAYTAWLAGYLWIVKGMLTSILSCLFRIKEVYLSVKPDFIGGNKNTRVFCIVRVATAHIILIGIYLVYLRIRRFRHGTERK